MSERPQVGRYTLVLRVGDGSRVRRYSLARIGVSRRSALGEDRHERLERVAGLGQDDPLAPDGPLASDEPISPNGAGPSRVADPDPGPAAT